MRSGINIILDKASKIAYIDIEGYIGDVWVSDEKKAATKERIKQELKDIAEIKADKIIVDINSLGGDINHGISIHDLLAENSAEITTIIHGMTASAATVIALAGDNRKMSENSLALIHQPSTGTWGNINDFEASLDTLKKINDRIVKMYANTGGQTKKTYRDLMNANNGKGKWIDAEEMKNIGLVTEIVQPKKIAANVDQVIFSRLGYPIPESTLLQKCNAQNPNQGTKIERFMKTVSDFFAQTSQCNSNQKQNNMANSKWTLEQLQEQIKVMQQKIEDQANEINELKENKNQNSNLTLEQLQEQIKVMQQKIEDQANEIQVILEKPATVPTGGKTQDPPINDNKPEWQQIDDEILKPYI